MSGTYSNLLSHVIFSTKNRYPLITAAISNDLHAYIGGIVREREGIALAVGGMADHVHLFLKHKPKFALSDIIRDVKAGSSKWINETRKDIRKFGWQDGFAAFSVSQSQSPVIRHYVENQEQHHRSFGYKAELLSLLVKNHVEYDEATLWD
jgi:putative transposase